MDKLACPKCGGDLSIDERFDDEDSDESTAYFICSDCGYEEQV